MFSGIVEEVGNVREIASGTLFVNAEIILEDLEVKDSICINGACLTVIRIDEHGFGVNVVPETLRRTDLGELSAGDSVNLERSLRVGDRLGGHYVTGHIDAIGTLDLRIDDHDWSTFWISYPEHLQRQFRLPRPQGGGRMVVQSSHRVPTMMPTECQWSN